MKKMICIICPVGCHIEVDDKLVITGNNCPRGAVYATKEITSPTRMLTSTVRTNSHVVPRLSVKTSAPVPKELIFDIMGVLDDVIVMKDTSLGDVIIHNILNKGVNIVATKNCLM